MKRSALAVALAFVALSCSEPFAPPILPPPPPPPAEPEVVSVSMLPADTTVDIVHGMIEFRVEVVVKNGASKEVSCSSDDGNGNLSAASPQYDPPTTPGTYTVACVSVADPTKSATATVTVVKMDFIAFVRVLPLNNNDQTDIFLMRSDGSDVRNITGGTQVDETYPDWSPNGLRITYSGNPFKTNVYVMDAEGNDKTNLTNDRFQGSSDPAWSPDGTKIAFGFVDNAISGGDDTGGIAVMNSDGTGIVKVKSVPCVGGCSPPHAPDWLSDDTIVFADGDGDIHAINLDGTGEVNLTNHPNVSVIPAVSPDRSRIAFTSSRDVRAGVYVMNADGSNVVWLTENLAHAFSSSWSPDGSMISFTAFPSSNSTHTDVFVMNNDGSGQTNLTRTPNFQELSTAWRQ